MMQTRKLTAELVGTFALVFVGAGAVIVDSHTGMSHMGVPDGKVGLLGVAMAHGLTLAGMIVCFGSISGGHFNPAVSFAVWLRQKLDAEVLLGYLLAQLAGALLAGAILAGIFPDEIALAGLGTPHLGTRISATQGIAVEAMITFLLVTTVLFVTREDNEHKNMAALSIGGTLAGLILFAGPLTGASANPARYLGPATFTANFSESFIYLIGPLLGAGVAAFLFGFINGLPDGDSGDVVTHDDGGGWFQAKQPKSAFAALQKAREHFRAGNAEGAVTLLVPLLDDRGKHGRDVMDSVRTLLMVIEEDFGEVGALDSHRHLIYSGGGR